MKKLVIFLMVVILTTTSFAQITQEEKIEINSLIVELESIDWLSLAEQADELISRADKMERELDEKIKTLKAAIVRIDKVLEELKNVEKY